MIIINFCTDDQEVIQAVIDAAANPDNHVFTAIYTANGLDLSHVDGISENEQILLVGHGTEAEPLANGEMPVIGDETGGNFVNAVQLWDALSQRLPPNFTGELYVDACSTADRQEPGPNTNIDFSFADMLHNVANENHNIRVFGHEGTVDMGLVLPTDANAWMETHGGDVPTPNDGGGGQGNNDNGDHGIDIDGDHDMDGDHNANPEGGDEG